MSTQPVKERLMPSAKIAYEYCVAMYFSQQLEQNLRTFTLIADQHGWMAGFEFTPEEIKRFKDIEGFLDKATCGLVVEKLRQYSNIKGKKIWLDFNKAIKHRNTLAHRYLVAQKFDTPSNKTEDEIVSDIQSMIVDIYKALLITRAMCVKAEKIASEFQERMSLLMNELLQIEGYEDIPVRSNQ